MTSTQKFSGFTIVPWFNTAEWKLVYDRIYDESTTIENQKDALNTIHIWKIRVNLLPSGIEGTLWILEALLTDTTRLSDLMVSALYGSSIMRFLNLCVASRADVFNFTKTAKLHQIPDWIIEIRHDFAHSYKLPSQYVLKLALNECLKWLKNNYWLQEMEVMSDYIIPKTHSHTVDIEKIIEFYSDLIMLSIKDSDLDLYEDVKLELKKLNVQVTDAKNWKDITRQVFEIIVRNCENIRKECWLQISKSFIDSGCFFMRIEEITKHQYQLIENLIILLHEYNGLSDLIVQLILIISDEFTLENKKETVALWLNDIFLGLLKQQGNIDFGDSTGKGISFSKVGQTAMDIEYFASYLPQDVNKITKNFIKNFMLFYENVSDKKSCEYVKNLEKLTAFTQYDPDSNEDMKDLKECPDIFLIMECNYPNDNLEDSSIESNFSKKGWISDLDVNDYKSCAIGVLPHQKYY